MKLRHRLITAASVLAFAGGGINAAAQINMAYAVDSPQLTFIWQNTDKFDILDSAYLTVTYSLLYRSSETDDSLSAEDLMDLQMGSKYNAFFSRNLREADTKNTESINTHMYFAAGYEKSFIGFDLLLSHKDSTLTETNRLPYTTEVTEYTEQIPSVIWKYHPEDTITVMGYLCTAATCKYGGREWKVYYTDRIPLPYGPWKLGGTPGLILKAMDTGNNFVFESVGLTQKPAPIIRYDWDRRKMKKDEWKKYERRIYGQAGVFARSTGTRILIIDNSPQGSRRLGENDNWSEYHITLER